MTAFVHNPGRGAADLVILAVPAYAHDTAPTQYLENGGIRFAYRRFGDAHGGRVPLVFFQHFRGNMDTFDPAITDAFAADREVVLFDNAGVGQSSGQARDGYAYLEKITQPAPVVNGSTDIVIATVNSFIMQQHLPNAQLIVYPDSGHGAHFQYPELFAAQTRLFLDS